MGSKNLASEEETRYKKCMYEYRVKEVVKVVDGDTVDLVIDLGFKIQVTKRVRLLGINAPEIHTRDLQEKKRGRRTRQTLIKLLKNSPITIKTEYDKTGKYGRVLGTLYDKDGLNINEELLKRNLAKRFVL